MALLHARKKYTNGEITIVWEPQKCCHSGICVLELPDVFDAYEVPWIDPNAASTEELIRVIKECPSAALTYYRNEDGDVPVEIGRPSLRKR